MDDIERHVHIMLESSKSFFQLSKVSNVLKKDGSGRVNFSWRVISTDVVKEKIKEKLNHLFYSSSSENRVKNTRFSTFMKCSQNRLCSKECDCTEDYRDNLRKLGCIMLPTILSQINLKFDVMLKLLSILKDEFVYDGFEEENSANVNFKSLNIAEVMQTCVPDSNSPPEEEQPEGILLSVGENSSFMTRARKNRFDRSASPQAKKVKINFSSEISTQTCEEEKAAINFIEFTEGSFTGLSLEVVIAMREYYALMLENTQKVLDKIKSTEDQRIIQHMAGINFFNFCERNVDKLYDSTYGTQMVAHLSAIKEMKQSEFMSHPKARTNKSHKEALKLKVDPSNISLRPDKFLEKKNANYKTPNESQKDLKSLNSTLPPSKSTSTTTQTVLCANPTILSANNMHSTEAAFNFIIRSHGRNNYEFVGITKKIGNVLSQMAREINSLQCREFTNALDFAQLGDNALTNKFESDLMKITCLGHMQRKLLQHLLSSQSFRSRGLTFSRNTYNEAQRLFRDMPDIPPIIFNDFFTVLFAQQSPTSEASHQYLHMLMQSGLIVPAYQAIQNFYAQNLQMPGTLLRELVYFYEFLLAIEVIYNLMPVELNIDTAIIYEFIGTYLREFVVPVSLERSSYIAFHESLTQISTIPMRHPQQQFLGFNFSLIVEEGFRSAFRQIFGNASPATFFVDNFAQVVSNNDVIFGNLVSDYGVINVLNMRRSTNFIQRLYAPQN